MTTPITYTEEQLQAAVAQAVADATNPLQARLRELGERQAQSEVDAAIAAAVADKEAELAEVSGKLDAAVLEAAAATERYDSLMTFLTEEGDRQQAEAAAAACRADRKAKVAEVAGFTEEQLEERADRWARMEDDEFVRQLDDYRAITTRTGTTPPPRQRSALTAAAADGEAGGGRKSAVREVMELRREGVDPRKV